MKMEASRIAASETRCQSKGQECCSESAGCPGRASPGVAGATIIVKNILSEMKN
jgi:hypothetical protein